MSRIDEAMRRAGAHLSTQAAQTAKGPENQEHAWGFRSEAPEPPQTPVAAVPSVPPAPPAARDMAESLDLTPGLRRSRPLSERLSPAWSPRLVLGRRDNQAFVEQFRRLAGALVNGQRNEALKTIMITSANPGDGKTLTAINLALVLSESYRRRVLLIDGDLRRTTLSEALGLTSHDGLGDILRGKERNISPVSLSDTLAALPAGHPEADPLSGLTSHRMQRVLHEAANKFDWVILDTPPLEAVTDAGLLCPMLDGTILVIRAGSTAHKAVDRAVNVIGRDRILGVVLNASGNQEAVEYSRYYSNYGNRPGGDH